MKFSLHTQIFDPKSPGINNKMYDSAYKMWLQVWRESYTYFGWDPMQVRSDQWMRQDKVLCLFDGDKPVATSFFDIKNINYDMFLDDSYFRMWPKDLLEKVRNLDKSSDRLVCSYFTLANEYRSKNHEINFKNLFHALSLKYFCTFNSTFMIGTMVKKSGMSEVSVRHGADVIAYDVDEKGLLVDLLYWENKKMQNFIFPEINELVQQVWNNSNVTPLRKVA